MYNITNMFITLHTHVEFQAQTLYPDSSRVHASLSKAAKKKLLNDLVEENTEKVKSQKRRENDGDLQDRIKDFLGRVAQFTYEEKVPLCQKQYTFVS